jgi:putative FmdB family regulatory protein
LKRHLNTHILHPRKKRDGKGQNTMYPKQVTALKGEFEMPLYSYKCEDCRKIYEVQLKLEEYGQEVKCPHCGKECELVIQPVPFKIN